MHLTVHIPEERVLELNWMWLPTFIGMNTELKKELEEHIRPMVEGKDVHEGLLQLVDTEIIAFICKKFPDVAGLDHYLTILLLVGIPGE